MERRRLSRPGVLSGRHGLRRPVAVVASALLAALLTAVPTRATVPPVVTDVNPSAPWTTPVQGFVGPWGGRVDAVAVSPVNPQIVYAAGEFSGLWRSTDGAGQWSHVDDVLLPFATDVAIAASDPNLIIATGEYDGRTSDRPPIWRSADGGVTWSQPVPPQAAVCHEPSAYHVAIAPGTPGALKVYVAGGCGLWFSADSGTTWSLFQPTALLGRLWDVQARAVGNAIQVDICGDNGFARSNTGGETGASYTIGANPLSAGEVGPCTLATAPQNPNIVYVTVAGPGNLGMLKQSLDGGASWTDLQVNTDDKNGRPPFVVTHPGLDGNPDHFEVYVGDSVRLIHQRCDASALPSPCLAGTGNWTVVAFDNNHAHGDPSDIVFDPTVANGCPLLTSNDGGVFKTTVPASLCADTYDWIDANIGLHGYEARSVAGTVQSPGPALYFATQDDGLYFSTDGGEHYGLAEINDDYVVLADHAPPAQVLWVNGGGHVRIADAGMLTPTDFNLMSGTSTDGDLARYRSLAQFGPASYAVVRRSASNEWQVQVTTNGGADWAVMGPDALPGAPAKSVIGKNALGSFDGGGFGLGAIVLDPIAASGPAGSPTFYLLLDNGSARALYRLSGPLSGGATLTPASLGLENPATFAVDPANPLSLYAFDVRSGGSRMMRSTNGGASWTEDVALSSLITRGNQFDLGTGAIGPLVSSIAFDPNSDTIMVGTETAGIFASTDDGQRWFSVLGAEQIPRIAGFFFDESTGAIYAASAGRGLWKIMLRKADLSVTKTDAPDPVLAGTELYYTITVANAGPDAAGAVTVTDTLPPELDFVTSTLPCTPSGALVTCDVGDLAVGQSVSFTIKTAVHADAIAATGPKTIVNNVSVASGDSVDLLPSDDSATTPTIVEDSADLEVTKLCKPDTSPQAGQPIDCSVFVDNHGPSYARGVVVDDTMLAPGPFQVTDVAASQGSCTAPTPVTGGQTLECSLGSLAAASTSSPGRAVVTYRVSSSEGQDIDNVAVARSDTPDPNDTNNKATVALTVSAVADLGLTNSGPAAVIAGTAITWTITVTNAGPSTAKNVLVSDDVSAGVTVTSVSASGGSCLAGTPGDSSNPTTCAFDSLAPAAVRTMTIQAAVKPSTTGMLHNDARVSSATFDPNNANDLGHTDTTVQTSADLALTFSADSATYKPSSTIHYQLTVVDDGPSDATGVVATIQLPSAKTGYYVKDSGGCILSNTTLTCELGTLAAGAPAKQIFIDYFVQGAKGTVTSSASVTSATPDPNTANNAATVSVAKQ